MNRSLNRAVVVLLALLLTMATAWAHEGHDDAAVTAIAGLPRAEAHSELFEIVAILQPGGVLAVYLDRYADNAPVDGSLALTIDGEAVDAERQGTGLFTARHPLLSRPGERNIVFTVTAGDEMDLLTAELDVPEPAVEPGLAAGLPGLAWQFGLGALLLVLGVLIGRASVRRPLPPMVEEAAPAPAAQPPIRRVAALALFVALSGPALAQTAPAESPRRLEDGAVFVPKGSQRLLAIRSQVTAMGEAMASLRMVGTLVPDPNASGRVQASQPGRLEPGEGGFPSLGQAVRRGQVLAYVTPTYSASARGGLAQNAAELDAQIGILQARVNRLVPLRGTVADRDISEAQAELAGARMRRAAIQPALSGREPLIAPVAGIVSTVRGAVGQLVDSTAIVFDIVDPSFLWVEALAFDRAAVEPVTGASATLGDGRVVELTFVGRGLTVRQQAVPMNFRVENPPADAPIGAQVVVTLRTARARPGIVLPADAVVRSAEGPAVVFEQVSAERFVPRQVRTEPLDGTRVVVLAGLEPGGRVVTAGAGLIAQVR